ncbi:pyridoxal phosphate-dependent aminotransferase [Candidatus Entotheonella palauensis]|uniref:pyridoxal phosphate-dependent aminotransferase n=1 Tax=Candidatus Entotheonella palauensis TaxID=93172 RepID=UPI000B7C5FF8
MNRNHVKLTPLVESLPATIPFVGPEALERMRGNQPFDLRMGANESAFGVSPLAAEAMRKAIERSAWYGDPEGYELREAVAALHGVSMDEVCLAGGIDELLGLTVRMFVEPGEPVVTSLGAYPTFNYHVEGYGAALHRVPYRDDHIDLQALTETAHQLQAKLVFLANPDNPMGTWHDADAVQTFIQALPPCTTLILDEAYIEFAPSSTHIPIDPNQPQVIRMRTFSKAHGMAGMRIGYAIAHRDLIVGYNKIRNHFGLTRVSLAGALASLQDTDFITHVASQVDIGRREYYALAEHLGLASIPSATNFVAIDLGENGDRARAALKALEGHGVFVRMPGVAPMDRCIRVTVGLPEERARFAEVFATVLKTL